MNSCNIAAFGWIFLMVTILLNNRFANQRETRKEIRSKLDLLNSSLNNLLDASRNYYLDKNAIFDKESIRIHESINSCDRIIQELKDFRNKINLEDDFYAIYEQVTGGKFESSDHNPGSHYCLICKEISIKKEELMKNAEKWYSKEFNQKTVVH